jgi:hypothetical protein
MNLVLILVARLYRLGSITDTVRTYFRWLLPLALLALSACASSPPLEGSRPFRFGHDSLAYPNELTWEYGFASDGRWTAQPRDPAPDYTLHCFVVARAARQFLYHARFDATRPVAEDHVYRELVREVMARSPRAAAPSTERIVIPGYVDLHDFSTSWESLLKDVGGGAWQSYLQRGNWRMVFPFSREHQAATATNLLAELRANRPPIVHVVRFPSRAIDHAVLIFAATETPNELRFAVYDPNNARQATELRFDRATRTFTFPRNQYFFGGWVDVYEVYKGWWY